MVIVSLFPNCLPNRKRPMMIFLFISSKEISLTEHWPLFQEVYGLFQTIDTGDSLFEKVVQRTFLLHSIES